ncbi:MAG TPA: hypothetical protein VMS09_08075 [Paenibacillus sp.]|uniref:hypothetical protein n=1 Tax=Paenibacillus sp. TaxID=58172 RepID=UPI002C51A8A5|nr:hypothetical protein [Paenibacillus sp.]HUC91971.1 hypothetical protein [Paenibacillus sp.]
MRHVVMYSGGHFEAEKFDLVENNGLSREWLELFAYLASVDRKKATSSTSTET